MEPNVGDWFRSWKGMVNIMKKMVVLGMSLWMAASLTACQPRQNTSVTRVSSAETQTEVFGDTEVSGDTDGEDGKDSASKSKVLVVYFSVPENVDTVDAVVGASIVVEDGEKVGNTEYVAKLVSQTVGGDLFRIETVEDYPLDHEPLVDQAADEQDAHKRPELKNHVENMEAYDTIILGYPNMEQGFDCVHSV